MLEAVLYFFGGISVIGAMVVVLSPKILHSTFGLLLSLFGVGGIYVSLGADFLGLTQILVYVGGVLVLLLFGLMLSKENPLELESSRLINKSKKLSIPVILLFGILTLVSQNYLGYSNQIVLPEGSQVSQIGVEIMTKYLLPFEAISILLLIALIGASYLARRKSANPRKVF